MKKIAIAAAVALMVGGCASAPKQHPAPKKKLSIAKAAPVEQPTPNQEVQRRWYDRFKSHPKWFR